MIFTTVNFGRYENKNKTLPQILFDDADWFFYQYERNHFKGALANESEYLYHRARNICIPKEHPDNWKVEYMQQHPSQKFASMMIVQLSKPNHEGISKATYMDRIDMRFPKSIGDYDKLGYQLFIKNMKHCIFGSTTIRMTKKKCEDFFRDDSKFFLGSTFS
ncbi:hypothetical protein A9Q91_04225 [Candidatus Gracilibacteria bacterium 28_42_T64]|nr:hypothetical protein A9Q91_04225 [Candidatus Gracilibacteria bacterium 28_42_T64]